MQVREGTSLNSSDSKQAPAIRPTRFESAEIDSLKSSVNLFRGDLNWQKTLVTLPGKLDDDSLQVAIVITYESNVYQQVEQWNLDSPTGVLGPGWSLNREQVSAQSNGALSRARNTRRHLGRSTGTNSPRRHGTCQGQ